MRLAAILARKDLLETARDRLSFIFILIMPLAFTLFFGLLFGAGSAADKLPLAVWDADGGDAAKQLVARLDDSPVVRVVVKTGDDLEQWMADDRAAAGLIVPEGYSAAVAAGEQADLTIVATQGSSGAQTAASEIRSLAGEQVTVELASRAAAEAVWRTRSYPAGAGSGRAGRRPHPAGGRAGARLAGRERQGRRGRRRGQPDARAASSSARRA